MNIGWLISGLVFVLITVFGLWSVALLLLATLVAYLIWIRLFAKEETNESNGWCPILQKEIEAEKQQEQEVKIEIRMRIKDKF